MKATKQFITRTKAIAALATTLMSTAAISSAALAEDGKVHPGSMCQPFLGADVQKLNHVGGATSGDLFFDKDTSANSGAISQSEYNQQRHRRLLGNAAGRGGRLEWRTPSNLIPALSPDCRIPVF